MLNKNRTRRLNTDARDHLYTKFERYLDIWSLNYHYHKIIILAQFKYWCKHPLRITRPSQNDKNMPRVSGRATVQLVRHLGIILNPGFSRSKRFFNPVFRPIISCYGRSFPFSVFFFFYLSFIMGIERTITVHTGRRTDEWFGVKKEGRRTA